MTRRHIFGLAPAALLPLVLRPTPTAATASAVDAGFPSQPYTLVRDTVAASHGNVARVKELVGRSPALARAAVDWGYGDWEDALGAASHVGHREIAEFLLANGARPTIFSAAMLGQLDAVKAFVSAMPGIEATHGPHSITLLRHAMAGGDAAAPVVDYLNTLPGADRKPAAQPITPEAMAALVGVYQFGPEAADRLNVTIVRDALMIAREGSPARGLTHLGDRIFYPAGATAVRLKFTDTADGGMAVSVFDPDLLVTATRPR